MAHVADVYQYHIDDMEWGIVMLHKSNLSILLRFGKEVSIE